MSDKHESSTYNYLAKQQEELRRIRENTRIKRKIRWSSCAALMKAQQDPK